MKGDRFSECLLNIFVFGGEEVRRIIMSSLDTFCDLDVIPTSLLKSCLDVLIKPITIIVNMSLSEGSFPSTFKHALVKPLLKKTQLTSRWALQLSSHLKSVFCFKSSWAYHSYISLHLESFHSLPSNPGAVFWGVLGGRRPPTKKKKERKKKRKKRRKKKRRKKGTMNT